MLALSDVRLLKYFAIPWTVTHAFLSNVVLFSRPFVLCSSSYYFALIYFTFFVSNARILYCSIYLYIYIYILYIRVM